MSAAPSQAAAALKLLSIVIPARDEEGCIASAVEHLHVELRINGVPHEILVVDDGSADRTWEILQDLSKRIAELHPLKNEAPHGFGRAVVHGINGAAGDAVVVMMADESDDCRDVTRYWTLLNEGWDCVFGSRFIRGGGTIDYPWLKLRLNRFAIESRNVTSTLIKCFKGGVLVLIGALPFVWTYASNVGGKGAVNIFELDYALRMRLKPFLFGPRVSRGTR